LGDERERGAPPAAAYAPGETRAPRIKSSGVAVMLPDHRYRKEVRSMPLLATVWLYGGLGIIYVVLLVTAGVLTIRNGHWVLFILGLFIPLLWIIGAIMSPKPRY
jgi:hypothetical protein